MTGAGAAAGEPAQPLAAAAIRRELRRMAAIPPPSFRGAAPAGRARPLWSRLFVARCGRPQGRAYGRARHATLPTATRRRAINSRAVELGRHVAHLLQRRIQQIARAGTAPDRAAACRPATAWPRSCRGGAIRRSRGTGPSAARRRTCCAVCSQISAASLSSSTPRCSLSVLSEPSLLSRKYITPLAMARMNFFDRVAVLLDIGLACPDRAAGALDVVAGPHQDLHSGIAAALGACGTEISAASISPLRAPRSARARPGTRSPCSPCRPPCLKMRRSTAAPSS